TARLQVTLELGPAASDVIRPLERLSALHERALRRCNRFGRRITDRRHGGRLYILGSSLQDRSGQFRLHLNLSLSIVEDGCDNSFCLQAVSRNRRNPSVAHEMLRKRVRPPHTVPAAKPPPDRHAQP